MVRQHHEHRILTGQLARLAYQLVHALVRLEHVRRHAGRLLGVVERMARIHVPPEYMADPIGEEEDLDIQIRIIVGHQPFHDLLVLRHGGIHVFEKQGVSTDTGSRRPGIQGPADGLVQTEALGDLLRIFRRPGEGDRMTIGVEVHR